MKNNLFQANLDYLISIGVLSLAQAQVLEKEHLHTHKPLEELCIDFHFLSSDILGKLLSDFHGYPEAPLAHMVLDPDFVRSIPREVCFEYKAILLCDFLDQDISEIWVALADIHDLVIRDVFLKLFPTRKIKFFWASKRDIENAIEQYYGFNVTLEGLISDMDSGQSSFSFNSDVLIHPTIRFVQTLLLDGMQKNASDIHFEPKQKFVRIKYRIDGLLKTIFIFHASHWPHILNRLKIISNLDIAETRHPQNGRFNHYVLGRNVDFRIASHPTLYGENLVIRILDKQQAPLFLENIGYSPHALEKITAALQKPEGLTIVTGPTGSGKTTTIYAFLNQLDAETRKIVTLEEPIEYEFPRISQTDIQESLGLDFSQGVKSLLRQDPDVILMGEIRDSEAAHMALRASMTGHQVFTTLHTYDAMSTIYRLLELGANPSFLAGHLHCIVAQRLLRKICNSCKKPISPSTDLEPRVLFEASGCLACHGTGYKNRFALAEIILVDSELNQWLLDGAPRTHLLSLLRAQGFRTFWEEALFEISRGVTTIAEAERVLGGCPFS